MQGIRTDETLLESYIGGNQEAFSELVARHTPAMRVFILTRYADNDEDLTDDVVQQTWMKLMENHDQYNRRFKLRPWLFSLAANLAIDTKRSLAIRFAHSLRRPITSSDQDSDYDPADEHTQSAIEQVIAGEDADSVRKLLHTLCRDHKAAIEAVYFQGMTFVEAAEHLNIPIGTLKVRVHRGLSELRASMTPARAEAA